MRKSLFLAGLLILAGCTGEETLVETEAESTPTEEVSSTTKEDEFIRLSIDYVNELIPVADELERELEDLEQVEDEVWRLGVESLGLSLYMRDTPLFLAANDLSAEQKEKYDSTIEQYEKTSVLITEIKDGISEANKTYDKRKLEEMKQVLPILKNELIRMKDQLEIERYE